MCPREDRAELGWWGWGGSLAAEEPPPPCLAPSKAVSWPVWPEPQPTVFALDRACFVFPDCVGTGRELWQGKAQPRLCHLLCEREDMALQCSFVVVKSYVSLQKNEDTVCFEPKLELTSVCRGSLLCIWLLLLFFFFLRIVISILIQKDTCLPVFIAALFITAKTWKQSKCP